MLALLVPWVLGVVAGLDPLTCDQCSTLSSIVIADGAGELEVTTTCNQSIIQMEVKSLETIEVARPLTFSVPGGRYLHHYSIVKDVTIYSPGSGLHLEWGGMATTPSPINKRSAGGGVQISYSCLQRKETTQDGALEGEGVVVEALEPYSTFTYSLGPSMLRSVGVTLDMPSPVAGFAAIGLGNGTYAISSRRLNLTVFNPPTDNDTLRNPFVQVVTFNTAMESESKLEITYNVEPPTTTTTTTTTTAKPVFPDQFVTVFVIAVDEHEFSMNSVDSFKTTVWDIMKAACPDLEAAMPADLLDRLVSCRRTCAMTDDPARGCVQLGVHLEGVPQATSCPGTGGQSRADHLRAQLEERASDLATAYSAARVTVDSCTAITWKTQWVWAALGLVAFGVLLAGLFVVCRGRLGRGRKQEDEVELVKEEQEQYMARARSNKDFEVINAYDDDY